MKPFDLLRRNPMSKPERERRVCAQQPTTAAWVSRSSGSPRVRSLVIGLSSILGMSGAATWSANTLAANVNVTNCFDSGAGSLRNAVAAANEGDTVVLGGNLPCSTITLSSGAINVTRNTLYLTGPGADVLAVSGGGHYGVLRHSGTDRLGITGLTLRDGKYISATSPRGGCVYSAGSVTLVDSTIANCAVEGTSKATARGGGIYAHGTIGMRNSTITGNVAAGTAGNARGGGVYVSGTIVARNSIFTNNEAASTAYYFSEGGGLWTRGNTYIGGSLVAGNKAAIAAAIGSESALGGTSLGIVNSTISSNVASFRFSAIYTKVPTTLSNSTIAFNESPDGGALYSVSAALTLQSSMIADNIAGGFQNDLDGALGPPVSGYNNLITSSTIGFPQNTITTCPKLGPLGANGGGAMLTHALLGNSPAINAGYVTNGLQTDQRGAGFPRVAGAKADIGAFERQAGVDDRIAVAGFEPVCDH